MITHYAHVAEDHTITMLEVHEGVGILITTMPLGGERKREGFYGSTDLGCQAFYRLTGVSLTVEEVEFGGAV